MAISLNIFVQEFEALPSYQKEIYNVCYIMPTDENKKYKNPKTMLISMAKFMKKQNRDDLLNICGRCGGTGLYDMHTSYTDEKGRPFCFKCHGSGFNLKKLSKSKLAELKLLIDTYRTNAKS